MVEITKTSDAKYQYANILIFGESGSGKTYFLGTAPENEMIIFNIVSESGLLTLRNKNIDVISIKNLNDMEQALKWLATEGIKKYRYVGIDSFSSFQKNLKKQLPQLKNGYETWDLIKELTKSVIDRIKLMPINLIAICEITTKDDDGNIKYVPSLVGSSKDDIVKWFDESYYFEKTGKAGDMPVYRCLTNCGNKFPCKSRIGTLPLIIENPTIIKVLEDLKPSMEAQANAELVEVESDLVTQIKTLSIAKKVFVGNILLEYKVKNLEDLTEIQKLDCINRLKNKGV